MRSVWHRLRHLVCIGALLAAGCAPRDDIPSPTVTEQDRLQSVAFVLRGAARGDAIDQLALTELLNGVTRFPPADTATRSLVAALAGGLQGVPLDRSPAQRLSELVREAMNGGHLDRDGLARLESEIATLLEAAGVAADNRRAIIAACHRAARDERNPRRDWW